MDTPIEVWVLGAVALAVVVAVMIALFWRARRFNLTRTESPDEKPQWMRTTPPAESVAASRADGEGIALYDFDPGEKIAAPFAEQIEDVLRALMDADPSLAAMDVDLGTSSDGGLEIWVEGQCYTDINLIPNERLRRVIHQAIEKWKQSRE